MMKILGCDAVTIVRAEMLVNAIRPEGRDLCATEIPRSDTAGFSVWIPRRLKGDVNVGDTLVVLCVPSPKLGGASETLVVAKKETTRTTVLYSKNSFWLEKFVDLF
ncbi:MAG: hypothetical protein NUV60_03580 [Patescibacteria group bacterium]|nr:hypothetical protein [Patescibacteria group bacterium]